MWKHSSLAFTCKATNWQPTPSVLLMCSEALCKLVNINIEFYILFSQFEIHACYCLQHSILTVKTNPGHIPSMKLPFFFFKVYAFLFCLFFWPPSAVCGTSTAKDWTHNPSNGSTESYPLDHQGSPMKLFLMSF